VPGGISVVFLIHGLFSAFLLRRIIRRLLIKQGTHARFGLDREHREVLLAPTLSGQGEEIIPERRFGYDTLVFAVGSLSNDFGIPGVPQHRLFLDSTDQAERFRQ
jgi:NADH:quinone reductase (non-electrogenic)